MIAYVDASVLLRILLSETNALPQWRDIAHAHASKLMRTEVLRTLDLIGLERRFDNTGIAAIYSAAHRAFASTAFAAVSEGVVDLAAQPMPLPLGTLDAIHLVTARLIRAQKAPGLIVLTHDRQLGLAARSEGFTVLGVSFD